MYAAAMTPDGSCVAFWGIAPGGLGSTCTSGARALATLIYTNSLPVAPDAFPAISISRQRPKTCLSARRDQHVRHTIWRGCPFQYDVDHSVEQSVSDFVRWIAVQQRWPVPHVRDVNELFSSQRTFTFTIFKREPNLLISENPNSFQAGQWRFGLAGHQSRWPVYCLSQRGHRPGCGQHQWHSAVDCLRSVGRFEHLVKHRRDRNRQRGQSVADAGVQRRRPDARFRKLGLQSGHQ